MIKFEYLKPLRNKRIIAFPDTGEYFDWLDKASELNKMGFDIFVSHVVEDTSLPTGSDLADIALNQPQDITKNGPEHNSFLQKKQGSPPIKSLAERIVSNWAKQKPEIWDLIVKFDLRDQHDNEIRKFI